MTVPPSAPGPTFSQEFGTFVKKNKILCACSLGTVILGYILWEGIKGIGRGVAWIASCTGTAAKVRDVGTQVLSISTRPSTVGTASSGLFTVPTIHKGTSLGEEAQQFAVSSPYATAFAAERTRRLVHNRGETALCQHTLWRELSSTLAMAHAYLDNSESIRSPELNRSIATLFGNCVGDVEGARYEFLPYQQKAYPEDLTGLKPVQTQQGWRNLYKRSKDDTQGVQKSPDFELKFGRWTDDFSMGLCLANTLLTQSNVQHLDQAQTMLAYQDWWRRGYNNGSSANPDRSVGLGGNISSSIEAKLAADAHGSFETPTGDFFTSGNGALMRNGSIPIIARDHEHAMRLAYQQSVVTHKGYESALCCQILTSLTYHAIHSAQSSPEEIKREIFDQLEKFQFPDEILLAQENNPALSQSVKAASDLAHSKVSVNAKGTGIENWNWKANDFRFNKTRCAANPAYIGSYAMDGLAMALHCIYTTSSFEEAIIKATHHGGDADTIGAITGQLAGAIYGFKDISKHWKDAIREHDGDGGIVATAMELHARQQALVANKQ